VTANTDSDQYKLVSKTGYVRGLKHAACDAFWEFSYNQH